MIYALIPAAGKSERMGRPKLSLPLGDSTVLQTVINTVRRAGIEQTLVVVGPHVSELVPLAQSCGAHVLLLEKQTPDMRATVERGLGWLEERFHLLPDDCWLLVPADHPALEETMLRRLLRARREQPSYSIFVPTFQRKRGHPTLLAWKHAREIPSMPLGSGINDFLRLHGRETFELEVGTGDILNDLDTPEDYQRLLNINDSQAE